MLGFEVLNRGGYCEDNAGITPHSTLHTLTPYSALSLRTPDSALSVCIPHSHFSFHTLHSALRTGTTSDDGRMIG